MAASQLHSGFLPGRCPEGLARRLGLALLLLVPLATLTPVAIQAEPADAEKAEAAPGNGKADAEKAADEGGRVENEAAGAQGAQPMRMVVRAVSKETGKAIPRVPLRLRAYLQNGPTKQDGKVADADGKVVIEYPAETRLRSFRLDAKAEGMVPYHIYWTSQHKQLEFPAEYVMRFERATTIGGVVRDAAGQPVKGASVNILYPATDSDAASYYYYLHRDLKTNAEGRWKSNTVPEDFSQASVRVEHPDYLRGNIDVDQNAAALRDQSFEWIMQQGPELTGRVMDAAGKPVAGAAVLVGASTYDTNKQQGTTDEAGDFHVKNCKEGAQFLCVTAEGHAPELQRVTVGQENEPLEVRLEPGATFRLRVVDAQGQPVAGAEPIPEWWRGQQMLKLRRAVDAEGRWLWNSGPHEEVKFSVLAGNANLTMRDVPLTASDEEQVITVHPKFIITGKVTNAATGEDVKEFKLLTAIQVAPQLRWNSYNPSTYKDGSYEFTFDELRESYAVRIEADGYQPAESPTFTVADAPGEIDFLLHEQGVIVGLVQQPDGTPAVGATVVLLSGDRGNVYFSDGVHHNGDLPTKKTGDDGNYRFNGPTGLYMLVALHDSGYAEVLCDSDEAPPTLELRPWGRIEGTLQIGSQPGAGKPIRFSPTSPETARNLRVDHSYTVETDANGHFKIERVVPGEGLIGNQHIVKHVNSSSHFPLQSNKIQVKSGETTKVTVGGTGRPVIGRAVVKDADYADYRWNLNEPARAMTNQVTDGRKHQMFQLPFDADGTFRGEDLPAGEYRLSLRLTPPSAGNQIGFGNAVGSGSLEFTIPEMPSGRSDEPFDLGEVSITLQLTP